MKELFKISKEQLNFTVDTLSNISFPKSPDLHHSSLKIKVTDNKVQFICKNFEAYLCKQYDYPTENTRAEFVVGSGIFSNLAKKLESDEISFFQKDEKIVIIDGKSQFTLDTIRIDYPERERSNFNFLCKIETKYLMQKIKVCLLKIEQGIFSFIFGNNSYLVARDNRKLAIVKLDIKTCEEISINVSENIIKELKDICLLNEDIELYYSDKEILFQVENYFLICRNHWVKSINYLELCNTSGYMEAKIKTSDLQKTLKKLRLMASSLTNAMDLQFAHNSIIVSVFNPSIGNAREEMQLLHKISPMKIKLNIIHFINVLQLIESEFFSIFVLDSKNKVVIKCEATYLLMPLSF